MHVTSGYGYTFLKTYTHAMAASDAAKKAWFIDDQFPLHHIKGGTFAHLST